QVTDPLRPSQLDPTFSHARRTHSRAAYPRLHDLRSDTPNLFVCLQSRPDRWWSAKNWRSREQCKAFRLGIEPARVNAKRLFISIELPTAISELLAGLDPKMRGVRWLAPAQMHLTLSFLGNVPNHAEEELKRKLSAF